jgi:N-acetylmuramoyl-L-alanine amidase
VGTLPAMTQSLPKTTVYTFTLPRRLARLALQFCLVIVLVLLLGGCATGVKNTSRTFNTVVIDAGHGGQDSGARSRRGISEKHAALDVARRVNLKLKAVGFRTVMTRNADFFVPLERRAQISNRQRNAIFVSIHFNHSRARRMEGTETYLKSRYALELAQRIQNNIADLQGVRSRGVKRANFRVLRLARYPAVLVECGFLSNRRDASRAATASYREQVARKIAQAIVEQRYGPSSKQAARITAL